MHSCAELGISNRLSIEDVNLENQRVLIRVDFNVPLNKDGTINNNTRILATIPTIKYCLDKKAKAIILMSHLGRPDGQHVPSMSLKPIAEELENVIGRKVLFLPACVGPQVEEECGRAENGQIILLENLRFMLEEERSVKRADGSKFKASDESVKEFCSSLSKLGDIYVNDAFGTMHRAHSSIVGIDLNEKVAGLLVKKELEFFGKALEGPGKIDVAILGGAKVTDKILLIKNLIKKVRMLFVGGAMPFTFLKELNGMSIGKSLFDENGSSVVREVMEEAEKEGVKIYFPIDFVIGDCFSNDANCKVVTVEEGIPDGWMGLDVGPKTAELFKSILVEPSTKLVLWNGPVGAFEMEKFSNGTKVVLDGLIEGTSRNGACTIVGGGDSAAAVAKWNADNKLSHVSTGGGASLELLEGKELPGITSLSLKK